MSRLKLILFLCGCLVAGLVPMKILSGFWAALWVRHTGYYMVALSVGAFLFFTLRHPAVLQFFKTGGRGHRWGIVLVILSGSFLHVHEPHAYFVQYDESVLMGTSLLMHKDRQSAMPTKSHYLNGQMVYQSRYVDKRPVLYPFLVSVVHDMTGYRPENGFVVNALAGFLLLGGIYSLLGRWLGFRYGILGVLLMMTVPLVAQNATGSGFDLLNAGLLILILNLGYNFVRKPDALNLNSFVFGLIVLTQARYESILYLIPGALVILSVWLHQKRLWMTWPVAFAPLLLLSPMLSIRVFTSFDQFKQMDGGIEHFFHISHLSGNLEKAVYYFFQGGWDGTNSPLLSLFGFISLIFGLLMLLRVGRKLWVEPNGYTVIYPFLLVALFNTVWALTNFWGQFTDPVVSRVTLPFQLMLVVVTAMVASEFFKERSLPRWLLVFLGGWFFLYTMPAYSRAYYTRDHVISRTMEMATEWVRENTTQRDYIIAPSSLPFIVHNRGAISGEHAVHRAANVIRSRELGFYDEIYLVMELKYNLDFEWVPMEDPELLDTFELELLHEEHFRPHIASRIYRVTGLKPGADAWKALEELRNRPVPTGEDAEIQGIIHLQKQLP